MATCDYVWVRGGGQNTQSTKSIKKIRAKSNISELDILGTAS